MTNKLPLIIVCGLGNQGSHYIWLSRNFAARQRGIDYDRVEAKNVQSQAHTLMGMGQGKVPALTQMMQGLFGFRMEGVQRKIEAVNVAALLGEADLVVDCLDNWTARKIITEFTREQGIPCVHAGLDQNGTYGHVVWDGHFRIEGQDGAEQEATCEDGENLPFNVSVAAELTQAVQRWLRDGTRMQSTVTLAGIRRDFLSPK